MFKVYKVGWMISQLTTGLVSTHTRLLQRINCEFLSNASSFIGRRTPNYILHIKLLPYDIETKWYLGF